MKRLAQKGKNGKKKYRRNAVRQTKSRSAQMTQSGQRAVFVKGITGTDPILRDAKPQIAFIGRSNVGKSSTINSLLGAVFARTSTTPGKTQEINFFLVNGKMYFVDLPGYGFARMAAKMAEKISKHIEWYLTSGEVKPACVVIVIDARIGATEFDRGIIALCRDEGHPVFIVANKADKLTQKERVHAQRSLEGDFPDAPFLLFSAKTKEGVGFLRARLFDFARRTNSL